MNEHDLIESTVRDVLADGVFLCVRLGADTPLIEACSAAVRGGLKVLEITLTTPGAIEAITHFAHGGEAIAGGGTVLTVDDVRNVAKAGGRFVLSPVFDREVVDEAHRLGLLAVPGTSTPTEILAAYRQSVSRGVPGWRQLHPCCARTASGNSARAHQRHHRRRHHRLRRSGSRGSGSRRRRLLEAVQS